MLQETKHSVQDQQQKVNRAECERLYFKYGGREWILDDDDESYFTKSHSTINRNDN